MTENHILIQDLTKRYQHQTGGELLAIQSTNLSVERNEFVCILGPSGCGKSTILNILSGLDDDYLGDVRVEGRDTAGPQIGYIFQEPRLLPWLTVRRNIEFALESAGISKSSWGDRIQRQLVSVGLEGFEGYYPYQLSGGMQQRTSIARALAVDPPLLLMDEPFSGLDELTARNLRLLLLDLFHDTKKTILFVTHNCFEATFLADRILLMSPRPGHVYRAVTVGLPRPRDHDDPAVFARSAEILSDFLERLEMG